MRITYQGEKPPQPLRARLETGNRPGVDYGRGICRVTSLIRPTLINRLEHMHWENIEQDADSRMMALLGTAFHEYMETAPEPAFAEDKAVVELEVQKQFGQWLIIGHVDRIEPDGTLIDWKTTTAAKIDRGDFTEWEHQLNIYAHLAPQRISRIRVFYVIRDYSPSKAKKFKSYPQSRMGFVDLPLWDDADAETFIWDRVKGLATTDVCTDEERWKRSTWAVTKEGRSRAVKVFKSEDEALDWMHNQLDNEDLSLQYREGTALRCADYCHVSKFCEVKG